MYSKTTLCLTENLQPDSTHELIKTIENLRQSCLYLKREILLLDKHLQKARHLFEANNPNKAAFIPCTILKQPKQPQGSVSTNSLHNIRA